MSSFATSLLMHTLEATLEHIEETPDLDQNLIGLLEFKETLEQKLSQMRSQAGSDPSRSFLRDGGANVRQTAQHS